MGPQYGYFLVCFPLAALKSGRVFAASWHNRGRIDASGRGRIELQKPTARSLLLQENTSTDSTLHVGQQRPHATGVETDVRYLIMDARDNVSITGAIMCRKTSSNKQSTMRKGENAK